MSPQKHDIGNRKRQIKPDETRSGHVNGEALAQQLVKRGLASPLILGSMKLPYRTNTYTDGDQ